MISYVNPNLGAGGGINYPLPPLVAVFGNNSFDIPNLIQLPDIGQNSDGSISDFQISGQSLIKVNWHNSRTSDGTDMDQQLNLTRETKKR